MAEGQRERKSNKAGFVFNRRCFARMPTTRVASEYNMNHKNRGYALIFNHESFENPHLKIRTGTKMDCDSLYASLKNLGFDVHVYNNKKLLEIYKIIAKVASEDHTDSDCILIAILSHGEMGLISAKDSFYELDLITKHFRADVCKTLAGKPKLFFIQACEGDPSSNPSSTLKRSETDDLWDSSTSYRIPLHADFFFAYSRIPGFYSWPNKAEGSWFIQSLCKELDDNGKQYDILKLLTCVCQRFAQDFEYEKMEKLVPCTTSMLTRILKFADKNRII